MADTHPSRRKFLKAAPVAVAGAVATRAWAQGQAPAGPITASTVDCAEKIAGLEFHAGEETAVAGSLKAEPGDPLEHPQDADVSEAAGPASGEDEAHADAVGRALHWTLKVSRGALAGRRASPTAGRPGGPP